MAARKVAWSFRSSISARSIHGHLLNLGLLIRIGSNFSTSPKRTVLFPTSFRLIALRIVRRIGRSRMFSSSNKNLSLTFRNPPFFTTSPMADTNLVPNFSLRAHSVSSSTLQHSSEPSGPISSKESSSCRPRESNSSKESWSSCCSVDEGEGNTSFASAVEASELKRFSDSLSAMTYCNHG